MNIVLLSPSGRFANALETLQLDEIRDHCILVCAVADDSDGALTRVRLGSRALPPRGALWSAFDRSVVGRNAKRLLPIDGGRRFAARARRSSEFRTAAGAADMLIALERDAVLATWTALQRWAPATADGVYGLAAGRALLGVRRVAASDR